MMPNRPEYAAIWFGLVRAGIGVALVNTNLTGSSLAHSLAVVAAKAVIVDAALAEAFAQRRRRHAGLLFMARRARASRGSISKSPPSPARR